MEILIKILDYLDLRTLLTTQAICTTWYMLVLQKLKTIDSQVRCLEFQSDTDNLFSVARQSFRHLMVSLPDCHLNCCKLPLDGLFGNNAVLRVLKFFGNTLLENVVVKRMKWLGVSENLLLGNFRYSSLVRLYFEGTDLINVQELDIINSIEAMTKLQVLWFCECKNNGCLTDSLALCLTKCQKIEEIRLTYAFKISDMSLLFLKGKCSLLLSISFEGCTGMTNSAVQEYIDCWNDTKQVPLQLNLKKTAFDVKLFVKTNKSRQRQCILGKDSTTFTWLHIKLNSSSADIMFTE